MATLSELTSSRELMINLTLRELRGKYKRSVLGWSWSLINPLATMAIFSPRDDKVPSMVRTVAISIQGAAPRAEVQPEPRPWCRCGRVTPGIPDG